MKAQTGLLISVVLLLVEGLSGIGVAVSLAAVGMATNATITGTGIVAGMAAYGTWLAGAAVGLILRRRLAFPLAIGAVVAGLIVLAWILTLTGPDAVILSGVAIWGVTLACLYAGRSAAARP